MHAGVGPNFVEAVLCHYPTPRSLYEAYRSAVQAAVQAGRSREAAAGGVLEGLKARSAVKKVTAAQSLKLYHLLFAAGT